MSAIKQFYRDISVTVDGEGPAGTAFKDNVSRVSRELFQVLVCSSNMNFFSVCSNSVIGY